MPITCNRRQFFKVAGAGLAGLGGCCSAGATRQATSKRPNIVIILADDMGFSDLGCYGGEIDTPHVDRLAQNGVRFTQFYNTAKCCPSRASLLTGLYPHKAGIGDMTEADYGKPGYRGELVEDCVTIAEALRGYGYRTYMSGKWHVCRDFAPKEANHNWPLQRGFDKFYGTLIAAGSQWNPIRLVEGNEFITPEGDFFYTEKIGEKAVEYIEQHDTEQPFFLYVAHTAPHWPLHARAEMIDKYRGRYTAGWDVLRQKRLERLKAMGIVPASTALSPRDEKVPAWEDVKHPEWEASRMEAYAAMVNHLDDSVGKVVAALKNKGQLDNTLIFFLSDNGGEFLEHPGGMIGTTGYPWAYMKYVPLETRDGRPVIAGDFPGLRPGPDDTYGGYGTGWANMSNTPFQKFKRYAHEGGISTPLILHWPEGIRDRNALRHQPGHVADIMATCLEAARAVYPASYRGRAIKPMDGRSLLAVCREDGPLHEALCWEHEGHRGVRKDKWKLAAVFKGAWELYDVSADRAETRDLAEKYPEMVRELEGIYDAWAEGCGVLPYEQFSKTAAYTYDNPLRRTTPEVKAYVAAINEVLKARGLESIEVEWAE